MDGFGEMPTASEDTEDASEFNVDDFNFKSDIRLFETEPPVAAEEDTPNLPTIASCYTIPDIRDTNLPPGSFPVDWNLSQDTDPSPQSTVPYCEASTSSAMLLKCPLCTVNTFLAVDKEGWRMHVKVAHSFLATDGVCSLCYATADDMLSHIEEVHMNLKKPANEGAPSNPNKTANEGNQSQKRFQCLYCEKKFRWSKGLERHVKVAHKNLRANWCKYCERTFSMKSLLYEHIDKVHEKLTWQYCDLCPKRFYSPLGLSYHKRNKHVGHGAAPPPQGVRHSLLPDLVMETRRSQETVSSSAARDPLGNLSHFISTGLPGSRAFQCNHCTASFTLKREVLGHVDEAHERLERYVCATCTDYFYTSTGLEVHIRRTHFGTSSSQNGKMKHFSFAGSADGKKYRCNHCQRLFTMKKEILQHVDQEHVRLPRYACDRCAHFSYSQFGLDLHKTKSHSSTFQDNGHFDRTHQNGPSAAQKEPSKSDENEKRSQQREDASSDSDDLVIVTEETPAANDNPESHYERAGTRNRCVHCSKVFFRVSEVLAHVDAAHVKLVRHQCQMCPRFFFKKFGLIVHVERSHGNNSVSRESLPLPPELSMFSQQRVPTVAGTSEKFYCQLCTRSFNSSMGLSVHMGHHRRTPKHQVPVSMPVNAPVASDPLEIQIEDDDDDEDDIEIIDAPNGATSEFSCFLCDFDCVTMAELNAHTDSAHGIAQS